MITPHGPDNSWGNWSGAAAGAANSTWAHGAPNANTNATWSLRLAADMHADELGLDELQLALAILSALVRLVVAASSVQVALTVYGHGVHLFEDEDSCDQGALLPERWHALPPEARAPPITAHHRPSPPVTAHHRTATAAPTPPIRMQRSLNRSRHLPPSHHHGSTEAATTTASHHHGSPPRLVSSPPPRPS